MKKWENVSNLDILNFCEDEGPIFDHTEFLAEVPDCLWENFWNTVDQVSKNPLNREVTLQIWGEKESLRWIDCNPKFILLDLDASIFIRTQFEKYREMFPTHKKIVWRMKKPKWLKGPYKCVYI